jgi:dTDP-4-amino-4,6-dideoxygalactose transaminase
VIGTSDFTRQWADTREDLTAAFLATAASGRYVLGREVEQFERELAAVWGMPRAVGVASGLDAIEISLRALGCKAGDKVLTTPLSAFATTLAIVKLGAVPVFADVDGYGLIDLDQARQAIERDPSIRYFVPVHLYGHALDRERLAGLRRDFDVVIVEDCAQSIGACWRGSPAGSAGHAAATSFYPTKNLGAMGEGGAILSSDESFLDQVRMLRDYGQRSKFHHAAIGYNSRLDELQAAMMRRAGMPRLSRWIARRREIAARYIREIRNASVRVPGVPPGSQSSWHQFPVLAARKGEFVKHLNRCGIAPGEHYPVAIPDQEARFAFEIAGTVDRAREFCASEVSLPVHPYLTDEEAAAVIDAVNAF